MKKAFQEVEEVMSSSIVQNIREQGHTLTGRLERSVTAHTSQFNIAGYMLDYGGIVDSGVNPSRIPFRLGSGAKSSKYITALTNFFILRGLNEKEAKSAAFATARKQKKEGMPTKASSRFSLSGKRKNFVAESWNENEKKVDKIMSKGMDSFFQDQFKNDKSEKI